MLVALCVFTATVAMGQQLEFVENKGQWPAEVTFKGNLNNGDFALLKDGYKVVLHNSADMQAIYESYHGHSHGNTSGDHHHHSSNKTAAPAPVNTDRLTLRSHAYKVRFLYANPNPNIIPEKPQPTYNNYFIGNDPAKWAGNCKIYNAVTYQNMYPGIDVRYYTGEANLKYDIIVHPGADISRLALMFEGTDGVRIKNDELYIKTSVQEIKESKPYSYQVLPKGRQEVKCNFILRGNILRFQLENYDPAATLVIDPELWFSTFTGSVSDNWGYTATYDGSGNFYGGGIVFGSQYPTNVGAFQQQFAGGTSDDGFGAFDMGIIKFNSSGTNRLYATYIGGKNGNEQPHSLVVDAEGNLIIAGRTNASDYPATQANYGPCGKYDIVISKLNSSGSAMVASRKFGGSERDGVNIGPKAEQAPPTIRRNYGDDARSEVIIDKDGNICLASCTQSTNFPLQNAVQSTNRGGSKNQDAVVIRISANLSSVLFSTYLGGSGDDAAFVIAENPNSGELYVGGATASADLSTKAGMLGSFQGGEADGFIAVFGGTTLNRLTYIGTNQADIIFGLKFDRKGFPYITGTTNGQWPIVNSPYNAGGNQANAKQYIAKLQPDLSAYVYSSAFGKNSSVPSISIIAFLVDRCENVYVSGWGGAINGSSSYTPNQNTFNMPVTPDAYMGESRADGSDFYFFVMERNAAKQLYGSYFGQTGGMGEHVDGGTSRFDENGVIYQALCANCRSGTGSGKPPFPTTPGAWSMQNPSQDCNMAAVKLAFNLAGVGSAVKSYVSGTARTKGCLPFTVDFKDTIATGKRFIWNFGDNSSEEVTTIPTVSHTYNQVGTFQVRLISIDSTTCNISDTSFTTITVGVDKAGIDFETQKFGPCELLQYRFINNSTPVAGKPFTANSFVWDFGDGTRLPAGTQVVTHSYTAPGVYNVRLVLVDTNYCNSPDSLQKTLRIAENVKAQFVIDSVGCAPFKAQFNNTSIAGASFTWTFGDGATSNEVNPVHDYNNVGTYTVKLVAIDTNTCNKIDSTFFTIRVSDKPTSSFTFLPNPPEANKAVQFQNNSVGAIRYTWLFGDGESLNTIRKDTIVKHEYNQGGLQTACLVAVNSAGCADTSCKDIEALVIPVYDVPSAFTPNGDGLNDYVTVRGFGIKSVQMIIYNRWGNVVFETKSMKQGWNGTYKGILQPQDVYSYVVDVEFFDGTRHQKKGDITLLR